MGEFSPLLGQQDEHPPNIIFILADDMGIGDAKCYNRESKIPTPHIDRLAKEGMRFSDAHAPGSICVPSRYGLLTGRYPFRKWLGKNERMVKRGKREWVHYGLPNLRGEENKTTIASLLRSNDYSTACFGKWHLGMGRFPDRSGVLQGAPINYGFDYYFGIDAPEQPPYAFVENDRFVTKPTEKIEEQMGTDVTNPKSQGAHWYGGEAAPDWKFIDCLPTINTKAIDYIKQNAVTDKPYFMYLAYPAPHAPWMPLEQFKGKTGAGQYGDFMMTVDWCVGKVLEALDATGTADNTLVIYSSDNGPVWYEADIKRFDHRASGNRRGMKGALHEGGHRMPFLVRWPGKVKAGKTCGQMVCFTDMMATFADIVGSQMPHDAGEDSFSILPYLLGTSPQGPVRRDVVHSHNGVYTLALRQGDYKLILPHWIYKIKDRTIEPEHLVDARSKRYPEIAELYNLKDDPSEKKNLITHMPEKAQAMFKSLAGNIKRGCSR
jgi:arylsulfatase A-like enzyme